MNGYACIAEAYRELISLGKVALPDCESELKIYDFLSHCSREELYILIDSGAFNEIIKCFCKTAMQTVGFKQEDITSTLEQLRWIFDTMCAKEVCGYERKSN